MQSYNGDVLESRVDWLTMTAAGTVERQDLEALATEIVQAQQTAGAEVKPWGHWGYSGFGTRHAHYGQRPDSDCLVLSSALADDYLSRAVPLASHISRLDSCVTARAPEADDSLIVGGYDAGRNAVFRGGHKPAFELLQHSQRGVTLYVGSRASRTFGRLYNKHRESELDYYAGCFRYEVEQKNDVANCRALDLAAGTDRGDKVKRDVYAFFANRGVEPIFAPGDGRLSASPYRPHTDDQRRLLWLAGQVRTSVKALIERGHGQEVLDALGLDHMT